MTSEPDIRSGLPRYAAERAASQGERLVLGEALLAARENAVHQIPGILLDVLRDKAVRAPFTVEVDALTIRTLIDEIRALRTVAEHRLTLLEEAADLEARRYDHELRYGLARVADDAYIPWSASGDAPVGWVRTEAEARDQGWTEKRLAAAEHPDADGYLFNSAGPHERTLTVTAILEAYTSPEAHREFRLTPGKVQCVTTCGREDPVTGLWDDQTVYWDPWHPDETPEVLPEGWKDRF